MHARRLLPIVAASAIAAAAAGDTVTLNSVADNTIYEESGALSNGAGEHMFAGNNARNESRRALLRFDLSSIPAGSLINSATLTLHLSRSNVAVAEPVSLHPLTNDWGEAGSIAGGQQGAGGDALPGDATWTYRFFDTVLWSTPGGEFVSTASATTSVGSSSGDYMWTSAALAADVQAWLDGTAPNHGWIVIGNESATGTAKRFDTHEERRSSRWPRLTIDFEPPADLGACCFPDGTCMVMDDTDCAAQGGTYQGDGTSCDPNPCPQPPTGACCFTDGSCLVLTMSDCSGQGGTYQGDGTVCDPNPCPQPLTGACCFNDTTCQELSEADCAAAGGTFQGGGTLCADVTCPLVLEKFVDALPIPPIAQPVTGQPGGAATYDMAIQQFQQRLHRDLPMTTVWGYDGQYPGPTILASVGQPVTVNWINDLRDETGALRTDHFLPVDECMHGPDHAGPTPRITTHLHGGHVAQEDDGYPEDTILPGQMQTFFYPNNQDAATLWYHDHALGITRLNVMMGMAGFYLLLDDVELGLNLPSGDYQVGMAIQDRTFNADGSIVYPSVWQDHFFGDTIMVNAKVWPYLNVDQGKYRFRWLNGSTSRTYTLSLSNGEPFHVVGTEGGLLPAPVQKTDVTIMPGERIDVVVDFAPYAPGTEIILTNSAPAPYPGSPGVGVVPDVMKFIVQDAAGHTDPLPATLRPLDVIDPATALQQRDFELSRVAATSPPCGDAWWLINGLTWDDITEFPRLGTTEIWAWINRSGISHPMHMHLVMFQVLDRQPFEIVGGQISPTGPRVPPAPEEAGWKDTVIVNPREIVRVIARFEDFAGRFAYHCHILEHEDHEMMRQFQTLYACECEYDGLVGTVDVFDLLAYLDLWFAQDPASDIDGVPGVDVFDLLAFLDCWFPASAGGACP